MKEKNKMHEIEEKNKKQGATKSKSQIHGWKESRKEDKKLRWQK